MKGTKAIVEAIILTIAIIGQIILAILLYNENGNTTIINTGWVILWISAIFGWLPMYTLKKWGNVAKGKSYIQTTMLVDKGVYAIVRHPQYLAGILIAIGLPLIAQHWLVILSGIVVIVILYINMDEEEQLNIEKFGEAYKSYIGSVPRVNFILGLIRLLKR